MKSGGSLKRIILACTVLGIIIGVAAVTYLYLVGSRNAFDALILDVFDSTAKISAYSERADTQVRVSTRYLWIDGTYKIDLKNAQFSSIASTTLGKADGFPEKTSDIFTIQNVSTGDDVYFKIDTKSSNLSYIMSEGAGWHSYKSTAIPSRLTNVAVPGPILDDLALFRDGRAYLLPSQKISDGPVAEYEFKLSGNTPTTDGPLSSLIGHVGRRGTIRVWIDKKTESIKKIHFTGDGYESTTTILNLDTLQNISAPQGSKMK